MYRNTKLRGSEHDVKDGDLLEDRDALNDRGFLLRLCDDPGCSDVGIGGIGELPLTKLRSLALERRFKKTTIKSGVVERYSELRERMQDGVDAGDVELLAEINSSSDRHAGSDESPHKFRFVAVIEPGYIQVEHLSRVDALGEPVWDHLCSFTHCDTEGYKISDIKGRHWEPLIYNLLEALTHNLLARAI